MDPFFNASQFEDVRAILKVNGIGVPFQLFQGGPAAVCEWLVANHPDVIPAIVEHLNSSPEECIEREAKKSRTMAECPKGAVEVNKTKTGGDAAEEDVDNCDDGLAEKCPKGAEVQKKIGSYVEEEEEEDDDDYDLSSEELEALRKSGMEKFESRAPSKDIQDAFWNFVDKVHVYLFSKDLNRSQELTCELHGRACLVGELATEC